MSGYTLYSGSQSPIGKSTYRLTGVVVPALYAPTIVHQTTRNASGTNIDNKVSSAYPLYGEVDGVGKIKGTFRMVTTFTALQSVVNSDERARIFDEHIAYLTAHKGKILNGDATP